MSLFCATLLDTIGKTLKQFPAGLGGQALRRKELLRIHLISSERLATLSIALRSGCLRVSNDQ